ncbi:hypothetical protein ABB37_03895 [Leptomonas pyrrhocoris]|uniref:Uncharacterized protein n=1 Tax=Leptomonas pyrrhocoris TaxID=157538 RepID=A0A0N0VFU6_LEPPY|nr:hypothetical protein ABB37_03895 [Leptomonas pyrrhocoris]KPA81551.1 hypothetical protein ABB37_03895 [Leptomonas pyrrhocoris]|eukprot:XP_015659990.1 hypothetical protein ABB37_03895 [Leptomonas pyrrhocoris]
MSDITVQLIFAFVGTRVPYHLCEPVTAAAAVTGSPLRSPFGNATTSSTSFNATAQSSLRVQSVNSSPNLVPSAPRTHFTAQQLLTRLAAIAKPLPHATPQPAADDASAQPSCEESITPPSSAVTHKAPLLELFDYTTMSPLDGAAVLLDEDVLLVLCDADTSVVLVEALQLEWLEAYSGTHRPHQLTRPLTPFTPTSATEMAVCTTEERLRNVAHARLALCKPLPLHRQLLEREFAECMTALANQRKHLQQLKSSSDSFPSLNTTTVAAAGGAVESTVLSASTSGMAERFPLLTELEPSLTSLLASDGDGAHGVSIDNSPLMCDTQLAAKETLLIRIAKQLTKLLQLVAEEEDHENSFAAGEHTQALQAFLASAEQDRDTAEAIVKTYQAEMTRQLKCVRFLVAHVTHLRNIVKNTRREIGAIELVLNRLSMILERPRLLEQAEALLRRRVILRRAARRQLLLLQETEYGDLQRDLNEFSHLREVQKVLPPKVRWYLRAPLPSLHPVEDVVATLLDHALIDRDVDEAQELVERTRFAPPLAPSSTNAGQTPQQINDALLPVERLLRRAEKAEAEAAAYKTRVAELELRVKEYESVKDASSKSMDTAETEALPDDAAEEAASK